MPKFSIPMPRHENNSKEWRNLLYCRARKGNTAISDLFGVSNSNLSTEVDWGHAQKETLYTARIEPEVLRLAREEKVQGQAVQKYNVSSR